MNKYWWFNLYSVHVIKHCLKWAGIGLVLDQLMGRSSLIDSWGSGLVFLSFYPLLRKTLSKDFRNNLEFHKMNIPFSELQRAYFFHHIMVFLVSYVLCLLAYWTSKNFGGVHSNIKYDILNSFDIGSLLFINCSIFVIYLAISQADHLKRRYQFFSDKKNEFIRFLYGLGTSAVFFMTVMAFMILTEHEILPFLFIGSTFALAAWLYVNRAIFHKVPEKATVSANIRYSLVSAGFFCAIYFFCVFIGRDTVLDSNISVEKRVSSFKFNGRFNHEIDFETFKVLEPNLFFLLSDGSILYKKINFDPSILGVEYFLEGPDSVRRLSQFLKLGKPSPEFLLALYDHFEKQPEYWKKVRHAHQLQYLSFVKWPKGEKLPERFIVARQKSQDLIRRSKSKPLEKPLNRAMASEKK